MFDHDAARPPEANPRPRRLSAKSRSASLAAAMHLYAGFLTCGQFRYDDPMRLNLQMVYSLRTLNRTLKLERQALHGFVSADAQKKIERPAGRRDGPDHAAASSPEARERKHI